MWPRMENNAHYVFINEKNSVGKRRNREPKRKTTTTTKEPDGVLKGTEPETRAGWTNASEEELEGSIQKRSGSHTMCQQEQSLKEDDTEGQAATQTSGVFVKRAVFLQ